jgi:hypothetical protein
MSKRIEKEGNSIATAHTGRISRKIRPLLPLYCLAIGYCSYYINDLWDEQAKNYHPQSDAIFVLRRNSV